MKAMQYIRGKLGLSDKVSSPAYRAGAVIGAGLTLAGCVTGGNLQQDPAISGYFEQDKLPSGWQAYYCGTESNPTAVIAIDPSKGSLDQGTSWKKVGSEDLDDIVKKLDGAAGARIMSKDGEEVGYWFSPDRYTFVRLDGKKITVYKADLSQQAGEGSGGGCFTADTNVLMADDSLKPIGEIQVGDSVKAFDFDNNKTISSEVVKIFNKDSDHHFKINGAEGLRVTGGHPFCVGTDDFKEVKDFEAGEDVLGFNSTDSEELEKIKFETHEKHEGTIEIFNMTVDKVHNFFVVDKKGRRFLVHNKGGGGGAGAGG